MYMNSSAHENVSTINSMEELDPNHFPALLNYSQFNGTNGTIGNLSVLNFDVEDENPYGLRYSMTTTVVLRYIFVFTQ